MENKVKLRTDSGKFDIGEGKFNFIGAKYKEEQPIKRYNFSRFTAGVNAFPDAGSPDSKVVWLRLHLSPSCQRAHACIYLSR